MERPFAQFAPRPATLRARTSLRAAITAATRRAEAQCMAPLIARASLDESEARAIRATATGLVEGLRARGSPSGVAALMQEFALSSEEGVALMCLAEALLRIPDSPTRDALIRDKIGGGDWAGHLTGGQSLFVNAATWGLVVTGHLTAPGARPGLGAALTRVVGRCGEPVIRAGVAQAIRLMGGQFVTGETIEAALARARDAEARGFAYSYDMLGEAAMTQADAAAYMAAYEDAIHAIGHASAGRGVAGGPGVSIKLSALHPRYARAQISRVHRELLPRLRHLAGLARAYDIGLAIDAEEADRLELSLDLFEALAGDAALSGWEGLGFVVQAYGKRAPFVIDWLVELARARGRRIMVRLVKGAYWDAEIKRAQEAGLADYPVYTRKVHTDVAYIACARALLAARDVVFPQFATHNAQTLATIQHLAGPDFKLGDYEFQCLQGMGEPLYEQVVGPMGRPCRIYAPVGTHEHLLAYLVRRLLENGANSSFVNRITDPSVPVGDLVGDPADAAREDGGAAHAGIALPGAMLGERINSAGMDLADEAVLAALGEALRHSAARDWRAGGGAQLAPLRNPADPADIVGHVGWADHQDVARAMAAVRAAAGPWAAASVAVRADCLTRAADALQAAAPDLIGLLIREAGKSAANAVAELREGVDFLRYYADEARALPKDARALGPVVCISPWNFPLAIFVGQVAAALVAGNPVLAKPAEETPLIAAQVVRILHEAGVPGDVLQCLPGDGAIGAALVADAGCQGVLFTGSCAVARAIQRALAERLSDDGLPIPLIAETGGQNAMIVDSSALPEQVVADVVASAFDSAGQRCSALRILAVQEDIAPRVLDMLKGAMAELSLGSPDRLATDIGPAITAEAAAAIERHIAEMAARGHKVTRGPMPPAGHLPKGGHFVAPAIIEIDDIAALGDEVFGPVLHVLRWRRRGLEALVKAINATGYGLTFGLHTRLDETVAQVCGQIRAGNIYINRNTIGAVVGVQPFGGRGLSGTGPKAGGPLYLTRLVRGVVPDVAVGASRALPGPVGETNIYSLHPRGRLLLMARTAAGLGSQITATLAMGNSGVVVAPADVAQAALAGLSPTRAGQITIAQDWRGQGPYAAALVEAEGGALIAAQRAIAALPGAVVPVHTAPWPRHLLVEEVVITTNTTAAGGNASLLAIS